MTPWSVQSRSIGSLTIRWVLKAGDRVFSTQKQGGLIARTISSRHHEKKSMSSSSPLRNRHERFSPRALSYHHEFSLVTKTVVVLPGQSGYTRKHRREKF
jgi:Ribonuclease G/E